MDFIIQTDSLKFTEESFKNDIFCKIKLLLANLRSQNIYETLIKAPA